MDNCLFAASAIGAPVLLLFLNRLTQRLAHEAPPRCNYFLDTDVFLQPTTIHPHLECMGALGRSIYFDMYTIDMMLFPLTYATFLNGVLVRVWPRVWWLSTLPFLACLLDVLENTGMYYLLLEFPIHHRHVEYVVSLCTRAKWCCVLLSAIAGLLGLLRCSITRSRTTATAKKEQ